MGLFRLSILLGVITFGLFVISENVYALNEPIFVYLFKSDSKNIPVAGLNSGDQITAVFFPATNEPFKSSLNNIYAKADVDAIFTFSTSIGTDYTGKWLDPYVFEITIVDPGAVTSGDLSGLVLTIKASAELKNTELTSSDSIANSATSFFLGDFDSLGDPFITGFVATDPDNSDLVYSNGDTITIRFNEATNQPLKGQSNSLTKANVDKLFGFGQNGGQGILGADYTGTWIDPSTFQISLVDITGATPPKIGSLNVTVVGSFNGAPLKNAANTSSGDETAVYANLTGSFSKFSETKSVASGGKLFTTLPSGPYQLFRPSSGVTESITVSVTEASTETIGGIATYAADVVEITGSANTCANLCTVTYQVNQGDLDRFGISSSNLRIFHDRNNDGDFNDGGEVLNTLVSSGSLPNSFNVTSSDDKISKFAVGGVVGVTAQAVAGISAVGGFWGFVDTCDEDGFSDGKSLQMYEISYDKCEENKITILADSTCGPISLKIGTAYGSAIAGMSSDQPFLNNDTRKLIFDHPIDEDIEWFTIIAKDKRDEFAEKIVANQCTGIKQYYGTTGYTSEQQGTASSIPDELVEEQITNNLPEWVKNNAKWWSQDQIDDDTFVGAIQFLIKEDIISVPQTTKSESITSEIPQWIKNNAGWWAEGSIDEQTFVNGVEYLTKNGIINVD